MKENSVIPMRINNEGSLAISCEIELDVLKISYKPKQQIEKNDAVRKASKIVLIFFT